MIPLRQRKRKRIKGHYRRKMMFEFDEELYHKRNLVETAFSIIKKNMEKKSSPGSTGIS